MADQADSTLTERIVEQLTLVGLREFSFDAPADGGFKTHETSEFVSVSWSTARAYAESAHEQLLAGDVAHSDVARYGRVLEIMADAIQQILSTAGFDARPADDAYSPATVQVKRPAQDLNPHNLSVQEG